MKLTCSLHLVDRCKVPNLLHSTPYICIHSCVYIYTSVCDASYYRLEWTLAYVFVHPKIGMFHLAMFFGKDVVKFDANSSRFRDR
jgi:hypothetical protein